MKSCDRPCATHFGDLPPQEWGEVDVTEAYHAARRRIFAECPRVEIAAKPGEAYLVHRLALHGMARWGEGATAGADGRMIVYFRPILFGPRGWLTCSLSLPCLDVGGDLQL